MAYYLDKFKITIDENGNEIKTKTSQREITSFLVRNKGLKIRPTKTQFIALEKNEVYINGEVITDEEYLQRKEEEAKAKKAEKLAKLNLTGADVERGIYKATGMDFDDIITRVTQLQPEGLDIKALKIELKANNFYRGNPYVDAVGSLLGFSKEQLDNFFEHNDYTYLKKEDNNGNI